MIKINIEALDHVVFNVSDPERSARFYSEILGLAPERVDEYRAGRVAFPSVRINDQTIVDFLKREPDVPLARANVDHIALNLANTPAEIRAFLDERAVPVLKEMTGNFGARGDTAHSFHIHDPDGNLLELQAYSGD